MKISINTGVNFQSKANPIKPFTVRTKKGKLDIAEVTIRDIKREGFMEKLTKFFCKNFASATKDPAWNVFNKRNSLDYKEELAHFIKYYTYKIKYGDENMTLLLAKDKRNKIQGACLSYGYNKIPDAKDKACYIDSIAINSQYRGFNIGKLMVEKTIDSAKNKFTDVFLAGDKVAAKFFESLGFKPLNKNNNAQRKIIDYISERRSDYPKYIDLYTKPLKEDSERWYDSCAKEIK